MLRILKSRWLVALVVLVAVGIVTERVVASGVPTVKGKGKIIITQNIAGFTAAGVFNDDIEFEGTKDAADPDVSTVPLKHRLIITDVVVTNRVTGALGNFQLVCSDVVAVGNLTHKIDVADGATIHLSFATGLEIPENCNFQLWAENARMDYTITGYLAK